MDTSFQLLLLSQIEKQSIRDTAYGCILSSFIGDTVGSYLKFSTEIVTPENVNTALQMPAGGPLKNGAGQITSNSEMALCLMWAIVETNEDKENL